MRKTCVCLCVCVFARKVKTPDSNIRRCRSCVARSSVLRACTLNIRETYEEEKNNQLCVFRMTAATAATELPEPESNDFVRCLRLLHFVRAICAQKLCVDCKGAARRNSNSGLRTARLLGTKTTSKKRNVPETSGVCAIYLRNSRRLSSNRRRRRRKTKKRMVSWSPSSTSD